MRLARMRHDFALRHRIALWLMGVVQREPPPDVVKMFFYRHALFGKQASRLFQRAMRGDSEWTVAERELMAAFVSSRNRCRF